MILVIASSVSELQGIEQFSRLEGEVRVLPNGESIVGVAVGVGKINGALGTAQALQQWSPSLVVGVGTCGAVRQDLQVGDIVLPTQVVQYDINLQRFGWARGTIPAADGSMEGPLELEVTLQKPTHWDKRRVFSSLVLGTADQFLVAEKREQQPWITDDLHIDVVDMEGYAIVKAARQVGCKVLIMGVVSDTWRGNRPKKYQKFLSESSADLFSLLAQYREPSEKSPIIL